MLVLLRGRPGSDLLSHVLGRSTIGAEGFHGRVRDGIWCLAPRNDHQVIEEEDALFDARAKNPSVRVNEVASCADRLARFRSLSARAQARASFKSAYRCMRCARSSRWSD